MFLHHPALSRHPLLSRIKTEPPVLSGVTAGVRRAGRGLVHVAATSGRPETNGTGPPIPHQALTSGAFRNYADHMDSPEFVAAVKQLLRLAGMGRTRCMCAETAPQRCHRLLLADYLFVQGRPGNPYPGRGQEFPPPSLTPCHNSAGPAHLCLSRSWADRTEVAPNRQW